MVVRHCGAESCAEMFVLRAPQVTLPASDDSRFRPGQTYIDLSGYNVHSLVFTSVFLSTESSLSICAMSASTAAYSVDDLLQEHPGTSYLPRTVRGLQWIKAANNWHYVASEAVAAQSRRDLRPHRTPRLPRASVLSIVARVSPKNFNLVPDAVQPTVDEGCSRRFAGGSAVLEDPEGSIEDTDFKRGWTNLLRLASIPLPMSLDVVDTDGLFTMVGTEPGLQLLHTFFAVRMHNLVL